jgi:hypothetical protein
VIQLAIQLALPSSGLVQPQKSNQEGLVARKRYQARRCEMGAIKPLVSRRSATGRAPAQSSGSAST